MVGGGIIVSTFKKISWPRAPLGEIAPSVYTLFCSPVGILLLLSNSVDLCLRAKSAVNQIFPVFVSWLSPKSRAFWPKE
jgi:hypothetical protein